MLWLKQNAVVSSEKSEGSTDKSVGVGVFELVFYKATKTD